MQRVMVESDQIQGDGLHLRPDQEHYLFRVLRLRPGAQFVALNPQGQGWVTRLNPSGQPATLEKPLPDQPLPARTVTLAVALPKQGFDEVVRQGTELGVSQWVPILSDRTLLRPSPQKHQRWQRIATEAAEQCERPTVPPIQAPMAWPQWLAQPQSGWCGLAVTRHPATPLLPRLQTLTAHTPITLAIGPEGGWTGAEIQAAIAAGYEPISLGPYILRAVTAPLAALALIQATTPGNIPVSLFPFPGNSGDFPV